MLSGTVTSGRASDGVVATWRTYKKVDYAHALSRSGTPTCRCMYCSSAPGWKRKVLGALSALVSFWLGCLNLYN